MTGTRTVLVPDLDDEITHALTAAEEVLLAIGAAGTSPAKVEALPPALARGRALEAVRQLWDVLAPLQDERAKKAGRTGRLLAPDGRYEHVPLRVADVAESPGISPASIRAR